jgi:hypothetical protein
MREEKTAFSRTPPERGLTEGAEVGASSGDADTADRPPANRARLPFPAVDLVIRLKASRTASGIPVVPKSGAVRRNRQIEDMAHGLPETVGFLVFYLRGRGFRVDSCIEENFVGVDVPDSGDRSLVEKNGLDAPFPSGKDRREFLESDLKGLGTESGQFPATDVGITIDRNTETEFPDVVKTQFVGAVPEPQDKARMLVDGLPAPGETKLSGHLQMKNDRPAAFAGDQDHLAAPSHFQNAEAAEGGQSVPRRSSQKRGKEKFGLGDRPASNPGFETPDNRLDFR